MCLYVKIYDWVINIMAQSDNFYVDELLKAEEEANKTIKAAQK